MFVIDKAEKLSTQLSEHDTMFIVGGTNKVGVGYYKFAASRIVKLMSTSSCKIFMTELPSLNIGGKNPTKHR